MRQIVLDTETTGIGHEHGHRIIEIGCVEMIERKLTGQHFHVYLNPQRKVDEGAFRVHGISSEFLQDKPLFKDVLKDLLAFIEGSELIIHNAPFDVGFINAELVRAKWARTLEEHCSILDTLMMARKKHPGQRNSLDALCKRYEVDNTNRTLHGALLDAEILASVYLAMTGGQASLIFEDAPAKPERGSLPAQPGKPLTSRTPVITASQDELAAHHELIQFIIEQSGVNYWDDAFLDA